MNHLATPTGELEIYRGAAELDLGAVEAELKKLWKRASEDHAGKGMPPVTRVGTVNLVALAPESTVGEQALGELLEVSAYHPGRILLIETLGGRDPVRAEASAHCHLRTGGGQVCSEVVRLSVGEASIAALPQIVASLLVADLAVVLWIPGDPASARGAKELLRFVDRVVLDSRATTATAEHFDLLAAWSGATRAGVADLAWHRLERWRALTAQVFDEEVAKRELPRLSTLEVEYMEAGAEEPSGCVEAFYFAGWIAQRLGWEPAGPAPAKAGDAHAWLARRPDGKEARLVLQPRRREREVPGDLVRVRLRVERGSRYEIERSAEHRVAVVRVQRARACPEPVEVDLLSVARSDALRAALEARRPDPVFRETVEWLRTLVRSAQ